MGEPISWVGIAMAAILAAERVYDKYHQRRAAKEKADSERRAALDKMEHDRKFVRLEADLKIAKTGHADCLEGQAKLEGELRDARDESKTLREQLRTTELRVRALEAKLSGDKS